MVSVSVRVLVCSINSQCHSKINTTTINNKIYTGVLGSFRLVGDDGDLSAAVSVSKISVKWRTSSAAFSVLREQFDFSAYVQFNNNNNSNSYLPGTRPGVGGSSIDFREIFPPAEPPGPPPPPPLPGGAPSSNKSHIRKSEACSTSSSTVSPVRSIIAQTSSKLRSTNDIPFHSSTYTRVSPNKLQIAVQIKWKYVVWDFRV